MSLIKNNAKVAAQIAVELARLQSPSVGGGESVHVYADGGGSKNGRPLVIGGSILDVHYHVLDDNLEVSCKPLLVMKHERKISTQNRWKRVVES